MELELQYWHWIVVGFMLILSEIFLGSFFIIWFGVSALSVGVAMLTIPNMSEAAQIIIWAFASLMFALGWFKFVKPLSRDNTKAGLSKEALLGQIGQVLDPPNGEKFGMLRFPAPLLGSDEWLIISQDDLTVGDRVSVIDLSGNSLIVTRV
jgi:membrane protein implicated in regulation of membrane protease activity|tara:strand:+ start:30 stop:482 length:453 start_codon:yes stop_codon:yes gene_type:complete